VSAKGPPLLEVRGLVKHFPIADGMIAHWPTGAVKAVDDITLDVFRGETLGIVGERGCGKSTTARLITRLLEPTSGEVRFEGQDITNRKGAALISLRREMQMIFQDAYSSLNPSRTVGASIAEPYAIHGLESGEVARDQRVQELMRMVGLDPELRGRYPHELSGGDRQRIVVARALALRPKLLVADEPVSGLDVSVQAQILNLLRSLQSQLGLTVILLARDLSIARHMCDRVAVMYMGKIVELAPGATLCSFPRHPYTGALLSAVLVPDPEGRHRKRELLRSDASSSADPPPGCRFHTRCPKAQQLCSGHEPPLADKGEGTVAACHFPLTREEADSRLPERSMGLGAAGEPAAPV